MGHHVSRRPDPGGPIIDPVPHSALGAPALDEGLADEAVARVRTWLDDARARSTAADEATSGQLHQLIEDPDGVAFTMQFVDRVIRPDDPAVAAFQLEHLVNSDRPLPEFLGRTDQLLLRAGARLAPKLPRIVMPLARRRMRQIVGHLVVDARDADLRRHLRERREAGFSLNVNLLGEAVLGEQEAARRLDATLSLLRQPDVDYVSVKISAIASQLNHWAFADNLRRIADRLRVIMRTAKETSAFVNLDMEEYQDLELTMAAFQLVLDEPEFLELEAGIVLQAYLPDSFDALRELVAWAGARAARGGSDIKIRLVKGANLAMERVDAVMHGWDQAPYTTKSDTDANYKRCVDWALTPERTAAVRFGIGSHNLFDVAFARLVAEQRGVTDRVEIEMLQGMAPAHARTIRSEADGLLLYTPIVDPADFDVAISYLFRRLEENAAPGNFLRDIERLTDGSAAFAAQEFAFRMAVDERWQVRAGRRRGATSRTGDREAPFRNEPESDPTSPEARADAVRSIITPSASPTTDVCESLLDVESRIEAGRAAQKTWGEVEPADRRRILHAVADELGRRRGDLASAMIHEGRKTFAQADPEICEAIDFARYYGDRCLDLEDAAAFFIPFGVVAVIPPWNFPVAIPAGGMLAALAAGNAVIVKPAPETPRCAEIVAECCWAAGVPGEALQFLRVPENELGRTLVTECDAVILTGGTATAELFRSWKPDIRLFAETSGKNAMVITPNADIDLAVRDLVASAFGHAGQKCSAASLAICVGGVERTERFRRQLRDAVTSLAVGESTAITTTVNGLIAEPGADLHRALTSLDPGEEWLVEPAMVDGDPRLWTPGVRLGVKPESWFHRTECFGPVLGIISTGTLDDAIAIQNSSEFGLTGGIQSLDPAEIEQWVDRVDVGNAYVNRSITGAIVQRQPFGGWKRSSVGPGAKAGGRNYVRQLGRWIPTSEPPAAGSVGWMEAAVEDDERWWAAEFGIDHDPAGLFCESNVFRYRPLPKVGLRVPRGVPTAYVARIRAAAERCGVPLEESWETDEDEHHFIPRFASLRVQRVRTLGPVTTEVRRAANEANIHLIDDAVTRSGRLELAHYLREQAVSETLHRFGNLVGGR